MKDRIPYIHIKEICPILDFYNENVEYDGLLLPIRKGGVFRITISNTKREREIIKSPIYCN